MAEELDEFAPDPSYVLTPAKRMLYFVLALAPVLPAAYLFIKIFVVDVARSRVTITAGIALTAVALTEAYNNLLFARAERIRADSSPPTKASFKGKKSDYDNALVAYEKSIKNTALAYSLYYNNTLFLIAVPFIGCYVFAGKVSGDLNFLISAGASAALAVYNSQSAIKALSK